MTWTKVYRQSFYSKGSGQKPVVAISTDRAAAIDTHGRETGGLLLLQHERA